MCLSGIIIFRNIKKSDFVIALFSHKFEIGCLINYLSSTVAPASLSFASIAFASSAETFSFIVAGAPSTIALASERPSCKSSRTTLITAILFAPTSLRTTVNSVFSSAAGAPAAGAAATATGAAAETPNCLLQRLSMF